LERLTIPTGSGGYDVVIDSGLFDRAGEYLGSFARDGRIVVVTDANVATAQLPRLERAMAQSGVPLDAIVLPAGEASKSWASLEHLLDSLATRGVERGDTIVALGGGVVGDVAGLAAALHLRGCGWVMIPTTLLAQVDSSIGGKTAINAQAGKNLVGAFHPPALVLIDPNSLATLASRELRSGYAEVAKYGLIGDPAFFGWCEGNAASFLGGDCYAARYAIDRCVRAKAAIVAADERETTGTRALLNLGHSFGHAIEAWHEYGPAITHGEAVAAGIALAFGYSARLGLCSTDDARRVAEHFRRIGLPDGLAAAQVSATGAELVGLMGRDKKVRGGQLTLVLVRGIGEAFVASSIDRGDLTDFLNSPV